ncbi:metal-dependent transcriptional regulator [Robertkochia marina]|uniref:Transcriptional regulator MntR n=1 Tax=Robertkochia marina TaxID=1227945 RepID=A0A4S3M488_9FLAO|nr:metal-dependent transcriptional regulator [Robertkochia marina]THD69121.1 metal-dependent transcriptional regulator [Robertkochia marina]TRZ47620.1 metal-dependent transcriptional regulator [Robertkochia marina]
MTLSEEDYLKTIYHLSRNNQELIATNAIAGRMDTKASSVTDMLKKLAEKGLITYKKYQGAGLTEKGQVMAAKIVRRHRLWEVFLVEKLQFSWDEVHDIAEELEHIKSEKLIEKLDDFLNHPRFDPHGDPIPDKNGVIKSMVKVPIASASEGERGLVVGVKNSSSEFLQYLDKMQIALGMEISIIRREPFDNSVEISCQDRTFTISALTANNIYLKII